MALKSRVFHDLLHFASTPRLRSAVAFAAISFAICHLAVLETAPAGMRFAASADDWAKLFNRAVKDGARPLLILWPFVPVALVYDVADTDGAPLPEDVLSPFRASGPITQERLNRFAKRRRPPRKARLPYSN